MVDLDFRDLALLKDFIEGSHLSKTTGIMLKDMNLDRSGHTIYRRLVRLESRGFLGRGFRISNAYTYFITQKGIEFYREAIN